MADKKIIKVGAAIHDDIRGLQKLREFNPGGFVDLQKIVWEWGIKDKSVKKMAAENQTHGNLKFLIFLALLKL